MRLHTFLLIALCVVLARSATIPEKNIVIVSEDKTPIQEEQIDQANFINDVDNKLRLKPADIPVEVVVDNVNPALKTSADKDNADEIVREPIDLKNPGLPQRQEHDTQSPESATAEHNLVEIYKKSINEAQVILKQGFQDVSDSIQNMFEKKDKVDVIQHSIESLRKGFVEQINKVNATVLSYLDSNNGASPAEKQTKAQIEQLKSGLNNLKSEFNKGVNTLVDGVVVFSSLKADGGEETPAPPGASNVFSGFLNNIQQYLTFPPFPGQATTDATPEGAQSDTEETGSTAAPSNPWFPWANPFAGATSGQQNDNEQSQTGGFGSGNGPFVQAWNAFVNALPGSSQQPDPNKPDPVTEDKPSEQTASESKPEADKPSEPAASSQVEKTTLGPIRQILQNNPITQGIVSAVQNLQNINNPVKLREPEKEKENDEEKPASDQDTLKGRPGYPAVGDNNNDSGIEKTQSPKEVPQELLPEPQEPQQEAEKEHKTEVVADKTE